MVLQLFLPCGARPSCPVYWFAPLHPDVKLGASDFQKGSIHRAHCGFVYLTKERERASLCINADNFQLSLAWALHPHPILAFPIVLAPLFFSVPLIILLSVPFWDKTTNSSPCRMQSNFLFLTAILGSWQPFFREPPTLGGLDLRGWGPISRVHIFAKKVSFKRNLKMSVSKSYRDFTVVLY